MKRPRLTIVAGANGSGKTTLTGWNSDVFRAIPILDPDAIAKALQLTSPAAFPIAAARQVLASAKEHIGKHESFAVETTLAGKHYLQMMADARICGFEVVLVYIGTEDVEINLSRIRDRVLAGGHDVPESDVRRRYQRSFKNLPTAMERADHTILFDNSTEEGYRLVAVLGPSGSQWFKPIPGWAKANQN
ncbi:MAG: zeta toxin family protein [Candidatus Sulfotelmatobacter sp.]